MAGRKIDIDEKIERAQEDVTRAKKNMMLQSKLSKN